MKVKWHGVTSSERKLNGGGPQGATFGVWEYLAQSNENANCVDPDYRYKFVDELTILEKVNILVTGLTSFNIKASIPSDIPTHNQYIPKENLSSNNHLKYIERWTDNKKMILNQKKTKQMIFNYTHKHFDPPPARHSAEAPLRHAGLLFGWDCAACVAAFTFALGLALGTGWWRV